VPTERADDERPGIRGIDEGDGDVREAEDLVHGVGGTPEHLAQREIGREQAGHARDEREPLALLAFMLHPDHHVDVGPAWCASAVLSAMPNVMTAGSSVRRSSPYTRRTCFFASSAANVVGLDPVAVGQRGAAGGRGKSSHGAKIRSPPRGAPYWRPNFPVPHVKVRVVSTL
jgi:hypothetical protein